MKTLPTKPRVDKNKALVQAALQKRRDIDYHSYSMRVKGGWGFRIIGLDGELTARFVQSAEGKEARGKVDVAAAALAKGDPKDSEALKKQVFDATWEHSLARQAFEVKHGKAVAEELVRNEEAWVKQQKFPFEVLVDVRGVVNSWITLLVPSAE